MATEGIAYFRDDGKIDWLTARQFCQRRSRYACLEAQLRLVHAFVYQHFPEIVICHAHVSLPHCHDVYYIISSEQK